MKTGVYYKVFCSVRKETTHKPLKVAAAKTFVSSGYNIGTACFCECSFLFLVITARDYFNKSLPLP